jgi:hypothetical protein
MAELTGPNNCAECGTETPFEVYLAGDAGALRITAPNGELVAIPGLAICTDCAGSIMVGEREPTVTVERAVQWLTEGYAPMLASIMTDRYNDLMLTHSRFQDVKDAAEALDPHIGIELAMVDMDDLAKVMDDLPNGQRRSTIEQN